MMSCASFSPTHHHHNVGLLCSQTRYVFKWHDTAHRFLQCREEWLAELVRELDDTNVYEYVKRLTDVSILASLSGKMIDHIGMQDLPACHHRDP